MWCCGQRCCCAALLLSFFLLLVFFFFLFWLGYSFYFIFLLCLHCEDLAPVPPLLLLFSSTIIRLPMLFTSRLWKASKLLSFFLFFLFLAAGTLISFFSVTVSCCAAVLLVVIVSSSGESGGESLSENFLLFFVDVVIVCIDGVVLEVDPNSGSPKYTADTFGPGLGFWIFLLPRLEFVLPVWLQGIVAHSSL